MKKIKENTEIQSCTFKPQINKKMVKSSSQGNSKIVDQYKKLSSEKTRFEALYSLAKLERSEKERVAKSKEELDIELNMKECTFTPKFETHKNQEIEEVKGVSQLISKLRKGKQDAEKSKHDKSRKLLDNESDEALTVSINLPNGVVDTLVFYPNDNKEEIIQKFIEKHSVDEYSAKKLRSGIL